MIALIHGKVIYAHDVFYLLYNHGSVMIETLKERRSLAFMYMPWVPLIQVVSG